ncbi:MAG: hypothetical protein VX910_10805 [Candidatus Latescibacterota bacterium]|nr:hypothetical protein [Candidatus Latescibacterota bacterium]
MKAYCRCAEFAEGYEEEQLERTGGSSEPSPFPNFKTEKSEDVKQEMHKRFENNGDIKKVIFSVR